MRKKIAAFILLTSAMIASLACSAGEGGNVAQTQDPTGAQKYARQALPKLDELETRHNEMMQAISKTVKQLDPMKYQYDPGPAAEAIAKMRGDLEGVTKDFRAMDVPKGAESFAGNVSQWVQNEGEFIVKLENSFKPDANEIDAGVYSGYLQNSKLLLFQKGRLTQAMRAKLGDTQNSNAARK